LLNQKGRPTQNGHVESFNGRLRDECLNANWFRNLMDARAKITAWRYRDGHGCGSRRIIPRLYRPRGGGETLSNIRIQAWD